MLRVRGRDGVELTQRQSHHHLSIFDACMYEIEVGSESSAPMEVARPAELESSAPALSASVPV
jgi:hypothetical protein